jgi:hypothetical protein
MKETVLDGLGVALAVLVCIVVLGRVYRGYRWVFHTTAGKHIDRLQAKAQQYDDIYPKYEACAASSWRNRGYTRLT